MEALRPQKIMLDNIEEAKEFDAVSHSALSHASETSKMKKGVANCKYCVTGHMLTQCPAHGKRCEEYGKSNHSRWCVLNA